MAGTADFALSARPILLAIVSKIDALPSEPTTLAGAGLGLLRIRETGELFLNRGGSDSDDVGSLEDGDWFLAMAVLDGADSSIHLIKNDETTWTDDDVDDGGGSLSSIDGHFVGGWDGNRVHASFVSDVPADLIAYREGLARHYGFASNVSQTGMQATPANTDGWKVLHDGSIDYVLSVVLEIEAPGPATVTLLEVLNDAENGGFRLQWTKDTSELTVEFIGTAGTFADTVDLSAYSDAPMIVEIAFDASSEAAVVAANGNAEALIEATGFTFSAVQQNPMTFGTQRGWTLHELLLREGSILSTAELATKWGIDV